MTINQPEPADFIPYPSERVVGTIADAKNARAAIEALLSEGFEDSDIDILRGEDDLHRLDPTGSEHGFLARFQRTLIRALGPAEEFKHLGRHVDDLRAGRFVIMVLARQRERRRRAADILNSHGAEFVGFYGKWAWQSLDAIELRYGSCASSRLAGSRRTRNVPRFAGDCVPPGGSIGAGIRRHGIRQGLQNG
jgi:hypothetical protein